MTLESCGDTCLWGSAAGGELLLGSFLTPGLSVPSWPGIWYCLPLTLYDLLLSSGLKLLPGAEVDHDPVCLQGKGEGRVEPGTEHPEEVSVLPWVPPGVCPGLKVLPPCTRFGLVNTCGLECK